MDPLLDPRWDRLPHLFAGELAADEAEALHRWIDADPERQEQVTRLREMWRLAAEPARMWDAEAALTAIQRRTRGMGEEGRIIARVGPHVRATVEGMPTPRRHWARSLVAAAAAMLLVAGGLGIWQMRHQRSVAVSDRAAFTEFTTKRGQRLALRLQDGTLVTLAPGSTLHQPSNYGRTDRALFLDGEAYFVVTHDAARPFAVHTARAVARDLGTRFVVRAYTSDVATDVVVAEGSVAVDTAVLTPGERARVTAGGRLNVTRGVKLDSYLDWTKGRLTFHDLPLAEAARQLERWHDVEIRLADARTSDRLVTASFDDEPIADVIHRIATSLDLEVTRSGSGFVLRAR